MKSVRISFYWRYFLSFTLILLIPTLLLSLLNFNFIRSYYTRELIQKKQIELDNCGHTFSLIMRQVNNNIAEFKNKSCFYSFPNDDNTLDFYYEIQRNLQSSILTNSYLSEIIFVNELKNSIHTSYEMLRPENFSFEQYGFAGFDDLKNTLNGVDRPVFLQVGTRPLFASPFQRNYSGGYYSHIIFIFNTQALDSILTPIFNLDEYYFTAYYNDSLILKRGTYLDKSGASIRINSVSSDNMIRLELQIPYKAISKEVQPLINITCLLIAFIITLSFLLILFLTNKNYRPIRKLINRVREIITDQKTSIYQTDMLDEFEAAEYVLNILTSDKNELMFFNQKLQRDHLLLKLLNGKSEYTESFWTECRNAGLLFDKNCYSCYIISIQETDTVFTQMLESLKKTFASEIYMLDLEHPVNVILLVCSDDIQSIENRLMNENNGIYALKGIGKTVNTVKNISESYYYARHHGIGNSAVTDAYPSDDINALKNAILVYDEEKIQFSYDNIADFILNSDNFFLTVCIYSHFINTINSALSDLNMDITENYRLFFTGEIGSNKELLAKMKDAIDTVLEEVEKQNTLNKKISKNIKDVTAFINENYTGHNFTVKSMADFFGLSVSNLSHYYKQKTGRTLSGYIINLKIEHAKKLLETTNMNLHSISSAAGYTEISAFIKSFKKVTGITPGEYRKQKLQ